MADIGPYRESVGIRQVRQAGVKIPAAMVLDVYGASAETVVADDGAKVYKITVPPPDLSVLEAQFAALAARLDAMRTPLHFAASVYTNSTTPSYFGTGDASQAMQSTIPWGYRVEQKRQLAAITAHWHTNGAGTGTVEAEVYVDGVPSGGGFSSPVAGTNGSAITPVGGYPLELPAGSSVTLLGNFANGSGTYTTLIAAPVVVLWTYPGDPIS